MAGTSDVDTVFNTGLIAPTSTSDSQSSRLASAVEVLESAARIANRTWHPTRRDIYQCLTVAWQRQGMHVPYVLLLRAVRAVVPHGATALGYNDQPGRCATDVAAVFVRAARKTSVSGAKAARGAVLSGCAAGRTPRTLDDPAAHLLAPAPTAPHTPLSEGAVGAGRVVALHRWRGPVNGISEQERCRRDGSGPAGSGPVNVWRQVV